MSKVEIKINNQYNNNNNNIDNDDNDDNDPKHHHHFSSGDTIKGTVLINQDYDHDSILISYNCVGEIKWEELVGPPRHLITKTYYDQHLFHHDEFIHVNDHTVNHEDNINKSQSIIPFSFVIPKK